jgi:hypothetical protein
MDLKKKIFKELAFSLPVHKIFRISVILLLNFETDFSV